MTDVDHWSEEAAWALIEALPPDVPVARVTASGRTAELSWALSDRIAGRMLDSPDADRGQLRGLCRQAAGILRSLHD